MHTQLPQRSPEVALDHDSEEDVFHVILQPDRPDLSDSYFVNLGDQPDIFLRRMVWGSRLVGISVKPASIRLGTKAPGQEAMRRLADELVAQYGQLDADEIARHQYDTSHRLDEDSGITWSYEPFSESLYIDLEQGVTDRENHEADGYPHLYLRHACDDDRIVGMFMISVARYLGTEMPIVEQLRALARELVAQYAPDA
ncbi:MAG: hypothetical protein OXF63_11000 [Anaerolineaceae bacterium]|nr:hypothetical protein [Anaerolineaceae bacterium]